MADPGRSQVEPAIQPYNTVHYGIIASGARACQARAGKSRKRKSIGPHFPAATTKAFRDGNIPYGAPIPIKRAAATSRPIGLFSDVGIFGKKGAPRIDSRRQTRYDKHSGRAAFAGSGRPNPPAPYGPEPGRGLMMYGTRYPPAHRRRPVHGRVCRIREQRHDHVPHQNAPHSENSGQLRSVPGPDAANRLHRRQDLCG